MANKPDVDMHDAKTVKSFENMDTRFGLAFNYCMCVESILLLDASEKLEFFRAGLDPVIMERTQNRIMEG